MLEKLIKSKQRVQKHGEVFTPNWMVEKMLNVPGIKEACESLHKTFLEPAAGEGNFLMAILRRKLIMVKEKYNLTLKQYENYSLYALSTIYGIELLEDNAQVCVMNMFEVFKEAYIVVVNEHKGHVNFDVLNSAKVIISANIAQGNFITKETPEKKPIIFSEWEIKNKLNKSSQTIKVLRTEHTLAEIFEGQTKTNGRVKSLTERNHQLNIFELLEDESIEVKQVKESYSIVPITNVFKEETYYD
ncbi:methylase [Staphylococcus simulans]|uniref:methylase n=1 Tax=Staphylococcus simulans TaxID=1286 RepID=UPI001E51EE21|nr:methylase [Staphylococcus simulans]MCD8914661.1 methylase [Staphylococcus simulans]